ncbi:MAG: LysM peptidoglycan-binding domain-containing protein [Acidobacteria bacterium]|nr:LysM peptidoglycan-binding domain-containing protein [Acidobacteriota bacterium]
MDRLEELKSKYQSVLRLIEQKKLRMHNLHLQDNKLLIKASAGTQELKNTIWNQIKLVDPAFADLTCDISIDPSLAPPKPAEPEVKTYTVQSGDTLSKIAKQFYGNANTYMKIFEANKDQLKDPNLIKVGQVLKIPNA